MKIAIKNLHKKIKVAVKPLKETAIRTLKEEGVGQGEVAVTFVDDIEISRLNERYLGREESTDVLSFYMGEDGFLGDVVISLDTARRNAERFGQSFGSELELYVIHGILHLLGYEDRTSAQRSRMEKKQNEIFCREF